ncbi:MAG: DNA replication/repair protein RecF [Verrucomicrobiales bacterium]
MLRRLAVQNFRCFESARCELPSAGMVFVGRNAQGKTSLLEAICVLLRLQSPRTRRIGQLIRLGEAGFGVAGEWEGKRLRVDGSRQALGLRCDGEELGSRRDYRAGSGVVVWMGNEDLDLVRGGGESRRRYLDFLAGQMEAEYARHWRSYRKALQLRNAMLKRYAADSAQVRSYTKLLIEHGEFLRERRGRLCEELRPLVGEMHLRVSGREEAVELDYRDRAGGDLEEAFAKVAESETRRGVSLAGPHRDDVRLSLAGRAVRDFGSEGQQRTVALAMKLAQGALLRSAAGREPVYLIDDVFGELDLERRRALLGVLPETSQKFITTTHLDWCEEDSLRLERCRVEDGRLEI